MLDIMKLYKMHSMHIIWIYNNLFIFYKHYTMIRKLTAWVALCSLWFLFAGCTLPQPQNILEEELSGDVEIVEIETGQSENDIWENISSETMYPALADNMSLSLELSKWRQGTTTQGNTNSNPPYAIPLQVKIKNTSKKQLARVRPIVFEWPENQWPSMIVACKSTDEDHFDFSQNVFSFYPGLVVAGAQRLYTPKVIQSTNWTDVLIGANGEVTVQTLGWNPRFIHATTLQEGETIQGVLHLTCKLFVSTQAGINACGCHVDENPSLTDTACFQSCYPNLDMQSSTDANVDFTTPSAARTKVDESSIQIPYTGIATKCDFGCDMEYSFSL